MPVSPPPPNTKDVEKAFLLAEIRKVTEKAKAAKEVAKEQLVATLAEVLTCNVTALKIHKEKANGDLNHQAKEKAKTKEKAKAANLSHQVSRSASIGMQALASMGQVASTIIPTTASFG